MGVSRSGGEIESAGVALEFDAGSINQSVAISIGTYSSSTLSALHGQFTPLSNISSLSPDGLEFLRPISATFKFKPEQSLDLGSSSVTLFVYNDSSSSWVVDPTIAVTRRDESGLLTVSLSHFSLYAVGYLTTAASSTVWDLTSTTASTTSPEETSFPFDPSASSNGASEPNDDNDYTFVLVVCLAV